MSLSSGFLLRKVADIGDDDITLETMAQRIGPFATAAVVGVGDWTELYNIANRATPDHDAHPT